jgi:TonB family protein
LEEGEYKRSTIVSFVGHVVILLFFTFGTGLLPSAEPLKIGLGTGGGQADDYVSVGLSGDLGGGEGMYKPPVTPRPDFVPPPEETEAAAEPEVQEPDDTVFDDTQAKPKQTEPQPVPRQSSQEEKRPSEGLIQREPEPGKGTSSGASSGTGGGFGTGRGVTIGSGTDEGEIESWYIRQVEQRVGRNWLQTSLGRLERRVAAVAGFTVQPDGRITEVRLEKSSGISSVDLAVQRAIQASNPLPRLPYELRGRTVRFQAVFEYPPR